MRYDFAEAINKREREICNDIKGISYPKMARWLVRQNPSLQNCFENDITLFWAEIFTVAAKLNPSAHLQ